MSKGKLLGEALESWSDARDLVIGEAENIPADRYSFRPTPEVRSVAEMLAHILEVSEMMVGELCRPDGDFLRKPFEALIREHGTEVSSLRDKEELLAALRNTLEKGRRRFGKVGEQHLLGAIRRFDGARASRLSWMHHGISQEMYHGGQLATYTRLMGSVPALTKRIRGE